MIVLEIVIYLLVILLFVTFFVSLYAYKQPFYVDKERIKLSKLENGHFSDEELEKIDSLQKEFKTDEYEEISIKSFDNIILNAKYYEYEKGAPLQIMFHGYRSAVARDFVGGMKLAKMVKHNVLMVEHRGHGKSKRCTTSLGILEKYDCLYWIRYAVDTFGDDVKIILTGVSMGASTVLMASELNLPSNVACIIADSPFTSPSDIIAKVLKDRKIPVKITMPFIRIGALLFGGFKFEKNGAIDAVKKNKIPVLIIHGDSDTFVPSYMSKEIYYNCSSKKELHIFENADHCRGFLVDENRYTSIVMKFLSNVI